MLLWGITIICGFVLLICLSLLIFASLRGSPSLPTTDTSRTLKIENSPIVLSAVVILGLLMTALPISLFFLPSPHNFVAQGEKYLGAGFSVWAPAFRCGAYSTLAVARRLRSHLREFAILALPPCSFLGAWSRALRLGEGVSASSRLWYSQ